MRQAQEEARNRLKFILVSLHQLERSQGKTFLIEIINELYNGVFYFIAFMMCRISDNA